MLNIYYFIYKTSDDIPSLDEKNNILYENLNVHHSYKSQLKAYSKKRFDPFCRRNRILFRFDEDNELETTIGQLNFFRWTIQNSVLTYISEHLEEIESDMNTCYKAIYNLEKNSDTKSKRRKRQELSISATKKLNKSNVKIFVSFD